MSHVTQEQARRLGAMGFPQPNNDKNVRWHMGTEKGYTRESYTRQEMIAAGQLTAHEPSAEELMEWLSDKMPPYFTVQKIGDKWNVNDRYNAFQDTKLIDALYQATCWVLEGKK